MQGWQRTRSGTSMSFVLPSTEYSKPRGLSGFTRAEAHPLWGGTAKGTNTAEVRHWGKGRVVITVTTVMNSSIIVTITYVLSSISNLQSM